MSARLLSIGVATPSGRVSMAESIELATRLGPKGLSPDAIHRLILRTGVESRGSVLVHDGAGQTFYHEPQHEHDRGPGTRDRLANATQEATALGERACRQAFAESAVSPSAVTHLISASCTVMEAPGFDQGLMERLGLNHDVRRTHIGFMGCHAAINALAMAQSITVADPRAVVLVCCVELCTLHMHYTDRMDRLIANALFADGAAAAVVANSRNASIASDQDPAGPVLAGFGSRIFRDEQDESTHDLMGWQVGDHGFEMTLDRRVPELLKSAVPTWIDSMLRPHEIERCNVGAWAIHPGGPRIVQSITQCLELPEPQRAQAEQDALDILHSHGNMSSATVLFILKSMWTQSRPRPWLALAFGPGLAGEAAIVG